MNKRVLIGCGGVAFLGLGLVCLGSLGAGGVLGWMTLSDAETTTVVASAPEEPRPLYTGRAPIEEPEAVMEADTEADTDVDTDTEADTEADAAPSTASTTRTTTRRTTTRPAPAPMSRPFSAPGAGEPIDPEEDLGDLDLERSEIEILDEELSPREQRRLRREQRRND